MDKKCLSLVLISNNEKLKNNFNFTIHSLKTSAIPHIESNFTGQENLLSIEESPLFSNIKNKAINYLNSQKIEVILKTIHADSLESAYSIITTFPTDSFGTPSTVGMVLLDTNSTNLNTLSNHKINNLIENFFNNLEKNNIKCLKTASSSVVLCSDIIPKYFPYQIPAYFNRYIISKDIWTQRCEFLKLLLDYLDKSFLNKSVKFFKQREAKPSAVSNEIFRFFHKNYKDAWTFSYYIGSLVAKFIHLMQKKIKDTSVITFRGPNEHSMACSALANWRLHNLPYLIVITGGMMDEFKGTLANMQRAGAKGIIIAAECNPEQWHAFQGTISQDEDIREVLKAKKIPYVYMNDVNSIDEKLITLFEYYKSHRGPVMLLATQDALEASKEINIHPEVIDIKKEKQHTLELNFDDKHKEYLDQIINIINNEETIILWQCERLTKQEENLVYSISKKAGIGLADSLVNPGVVSKYKNGKIINNYIGSLGLYNYSPRMYNFLFPSGPKKHKKLCLLFLGSKIEQLATPFSLTKVKNKFDIVQVIRKQKDVSPFTTHPLIMSTRQFLDYTDKHLNVKNNILDIRNNYIKNIDNFSKDIINEINSLPMTTNIFFHKLNNLIENLIEKNGYTYTGIYDVGRCGASAVNHISRTDPGFSGWYGRALMGDALLSIPALSLSTNTNILAFIGDGAKGLVPSIKETFVRLIINNKDRLSRNITIFYCCNGLFSLINTYFELICLEHGKEKLDLINYLEPDSSIEINGYDINTKTFYSFDEQEMRKSLLAQNRINYFSVILSHNNIGDGLILPLERSW
ncbi:hypothetical protein ACFL4O_00285 [bacterium]